MGEIPLDTGEAVREAAIVQLFNAYKGEVNRINSLREKSRRIRGMRYSSFYTMFRFAQLLGLVEHVRDEPMEYPPPNGNLYQIYKSGEDLGVRISARKIFRLTSSGMSDELCWSDLTNAWKNGIQCGQAVSYDIPEPSTPTPIKREKVEEPPPTTFTPYEWNTLPAVSRFNSLLAHLRILNSLGLVSRGVRKEVERISYLIGDWIIHTEDSLEEAQQKQIQRSISVYTKRLRLLTLADEALGDEDLGRAIEALEELVS
jgi:hypothetical protein